MSSLAARLWLDWPWCLFILGALPCWQEGIFWHTKHTGAKGARQSTKDNLTLGGAIGWCKIHKSVLFFAIAFTRKNRGVCLTIKVSKNC